MILTRSFDTNLWWFTTNGFQAFDVGLTVGANQITLHAQDLAGNMTNSSYTFTLDYSSKTNPPVVGLYWPTNGSVICGTNFGWRGWVVDPTVSVSAQIVDSSGDTNVVNGIVERNGNFWADNLPLASGTNQLTLTAVDAVGNTNVTNIYVVQSTVNMAFTSIPDVSNQVLVTIDGTLDTSGYTVWVNGVQATQSGTAPSITWEAYYVPVNGIGTAVFEALAITNTDHGGNGTGGGGGTNSTLSNPGNPTPADAASPRLSAAPDKKSCIFCQIFEPAMDWHWTDDSGLINDQFNTVSFMYGSPGTSLSTSYQNYWADGGTGFGATVAAWDQYGFGDFTNYSAVDDNDYGDVTEVTSLLETISSPTFEAGNPPWVARLQAQGEESDYNITTSGWYTDYFVDPDPSPTNAVLTTQRGVKSLYVLETGGKAASQRTALFQLTAAATNWTHLGNADTGPISAAALYNQITVMGRTLDCNYTTYIGEPDGIIVPLPVDVGASSSAASVARAEAQQAGSPSFVYSLNGQKIHLDLHSVTFTGDNQSILQDDGSGAYPTPHWTKGKDGKDQSCPVLYPSGSTVYTTTDFKVSGGGSFRVIIQGVASGGLTAFTLGGSGTPTGTDFSVSTKANRALWANKVDFYNPMTIIWQYYAPNNRQSILTAGTSANKVYVSWKAPVNGVQLFHTVVDVACRNAVGQTTADNVVNGIWGNFKTLSVNRWDGSGPLEYWGTYAFGTVSSPYSASLDNDTSDLLLHGDGKCGAWSQFFMDTLNANGIVGVKPLVTANAPFVGVNMYADKRMIGQGKIMPPNQYQFVNHQVDGYGGIIYDPSYGHTFTTEIQWQDASVQSFGNSLTDLSDVTPEVPGKLQTAFNPPPPY